MNAPKRIRNIIAKVTAIPAFVPLGRPGLGAAIDVVVVVAVAVTVSRTVSADEVVDDVEEVPAPKIGPPLALDISRIIEPYLLACCCILADWLSSWRALPTRAAYIQFELVLVKSLQSEPSIYFVGLSW